MMAPVPLTATTLTLTVLMLSLWRAFGSAPWKLYDTLVHWLGWHCRAKGSGVAVALQIGPVTLLYVYKLLFCEHVKEQSDLGQQFGLLSLRFSCHAL